LEEFPDFIRTDEFRVLFQVLNYVSIPVLFIRVLLTEKPEWGSGNILGDTTTQFYCFFVLSSRIDKEY
jgi:hypothetical protein